MCCFEMKNINPKTIDNQRIDICYKHNYSVNCMLFRIFHHLTFLTFWLLKSNGLSYFDKLSKRNPNFGVLKHD